MAILLPNAGSSCRGAAVLWRPRFGRVLALSL